MWTRERSPVTKGVVATHHRTSLAKSPRIPACITDDSTQPPKQQLRGEADRRTANGANACSEGTCGATHRFMVQRAFVTNEFASRLAYSKSRRRLAPLHSDAAAARSYARVVEMAGDRLGPPRPR